MHLHSAPTCIFPGSPIDMLDAPVCGPLPLQPLPTASAQVLSSFENTWGQIFLFPQSHDPINCSSPGSSVHGIL